MCKFGECARHSSGAAQSAPKVEPAAPALSAKLINMGAGERAQLTTEHAGAVYFSIHPDFFKKVYPVYI